MRINKFLTAIIGLTCIIFGTWAQIRHKENKHKLSEEALNEIFHQTLHHIKNDYVDDITTHKVWHGAIKGMVESLEDPHTRFMTSEELEALKVETRGKFGGLGLEVTVQEKQLTIISPIDGTPAMRAGIEPGDKIVYIDKKETKNMNLSQAVGLMRGVPGTSINIGIARNGINEVLYFDIIRAIIHIQVVENTIIPSSPIGYVKLKQFSQSAHKELKKVLVEYKKQNIKVLILDLRWNPGGLLDSACKIANLFISKGVLVSTKGRNTKRNKIFRADPENTILPNIPIIILANQGSASASEIVTGALKDHKRGIFIGTKTFGKGSVQSVIPLRYKTAIALTIQKYYTPSGVSIHKKGIKPDIKVDAYAFTKQDKRLYPSVKDSQLIKKFANKHNKYSQTNVKALKRLLKENGFQKLSDFSVKSLLKSELLIANKEKRPIFDLELDKQLQEAINYANKKFIRKKLP